MHLGAGGLFVFFLVLYFVIRDAVRDGQARIAEPREYAAAETLAEYVAFWSASARFNRELADDPAYSPSQRQEFLTRVADAEAQARAFESRLQRLLARAR